MTLKPMKKAEHFNELDPDQLEALAILMEEMSEASQVIGKILRHGLASYHPSDPNETDNCVLLEKEIGHVRFAESLLYRLNIITQTGVDCYQREKATTIKRYLHHISL